ncbi:hypothetical protein LNKW23_20970 [Paralimibaculum aggregatum]|uniref:Uncharacterized protein n=1 Tax=Paralimibaculum aggregatum TaxID=3036245 RepID=A0ABQ6LKV3_9RHOB|nr:hypothetical protein LNKW23_20970 [Limibaculum sp. NKW23]
MAAALADGQRRVRQGFAARPGGSGGRRGPAIAAMLRRHRYGSRPALRRAATLRLPGVPPCRRLTDPATPLCRKLSQAPSRITPRQPEQRGGELAATAAAALHRAAARRAVRAAPGSWHDRQHRPPGASPPARCRGGRHRASLAGIASIAAHTVAVPRLGRAAVRGNPRDRPTG